MAEFSGEARDARRRGIEMDEWCDAGPGFAKDGTAGLDVADPKSIDRALSSVSHEAVPALRIYDASARPRMLAEVDNQGNSALVI